MKFLILFVSAIAFNDDLNPSKEVTLVKIFWKYYRNRLTKGIFNDFKFSWVSDCACEGNMWLREDGSWL